MPSKHSTFVSLTSEHDEVLRKTANEHHGTVSSVIRACVDFCLDIDASLRLPLAQKRAIAAKAEYDVAMTELARVEALTASDEPKMATPLGPRTPPDKESAVFTNLIGPGVDRLEGQTDHDHGQFLRLVENWDSTSARAKQKARDLATKHPDWLADLDLERQQLVLAQAESILRSSQ